MRAEPGGYQWVLWNLKEAKQELDRTISKIEGDPEYDWRSDTKSTAVAGFVGAALRLVNVR